MGAGSAVRADHGARVMSALARQIEALLFLSPEPVSVDELADAVQAGEESVQEAIAELAETLDGRGVVLREVAGGWALASHPDAEEAARRLLARPRTPALTPAQAETLAIVGYLQPVSRPEVARIRGVASESATAALVERGLIEESGRSQFGAILYRTTPLFLKLFGLNSLDDLPRSPSGIRARRTRPRCATACCARGEAGAVLPPDQPGAERCAASCPQAASMSRPRVRRTVARTPCSSSTALNAAIALGEEPSYIPVGLYGIRLTLKIFASSSSASATACGSVSLTPASITYSMNTRRRRRA